MHEAGLVDRRDVELRRDLPDRGEDVPPGDVEEIDLGGGRWLVVRPFGPADVELLAALFAALDPDDLRRRFFAPRPPGRAWLERWCATNERGGIGLVALLDDGVVRTVVGEADCARDASGQADLGIAVAPVCRGWLGPHLLDLVLARARAAGITSVDADVLFDNRPMVALARSRGGRSVGPLDHGILRLRIPAA